MICGPCFRRGPCFWPPRSFHAPPPPSHPPLEFFPVCLTQIIPVLSKLQILSMTGDGDTYNVIEELVTVLNTHFGRFSRNFYVTIPGILFCSLKCSYFCHKGQGNANSKVGTRVRGSVVQVLKENI